MVCDIVWMLPVKPFVIFFFWLFDGNLSVFNHLKGFSTKFIHFLLIFFIIIILFFLLFILIWFTWRFCDVLLILDLF